MKNDADKNGVRKKKNTFCIFDLLSWHRDYRDARPSSFFTVFPPSLPFSPPARAPPFSYLRLSVDGLRAISVFVGATHGPNSPTCPRECMQCSCVFTLPLYSPNPSPTLLSPPPVGPLSRCSVHKWIHHPCVSCGTFLNRTHSDPL